MKKYFFILSFFGALFSFTSCGDNAELERYKAENDSLKNIANETTIQVEEFYAAFNDIQQNLNTIKQKEHIIDLNSVDSVEMTPAMKDQINSDILLIYELMQENEAALSTLKNRLHSSGVKNQELEQTLALYDEQMTQKDEEITLLRQRLEQMDFNMQELNDQIADMQSDIDTILQVSEDQENIIDEQDELLHLAYYVVGTKDELKNNGVLDRSGILSKLSFDANFDKSYFTKIDYRNLSEIPLNSKKVTILTQHPNSSYTLVEDNNKISKLSISNKEDFWSLSKFLVITVK